MEVGNKVIISLDEYNKLRDYYESIEENDKVIKKYYYGNYDKYVIYSKEKFSNEIIEINHNLAKIITDLKVENDRLNDKLDEVIDKDNSIDKIKNIGWWEFIVLKLKN